MLLPRCMEKRDGVTHETDSEIGERFAVKINISVYIGIYRYISVRDASQEHTGAIITERTRGRAKFN